MAQANNDISMYKKRVLTASNIKNIKCDRKQQQTHTTPQTNTTEQDTNKLPQRKDATQCTKQTKTNKHTPHKTHACLAKKTKTTTTQLCLRAQAGDGFLMYKKSVAGFRKQAYQM